MPEAELSRMVGRNEVEEEGLPQTYSRGISGNG